MTPQTHPGFSCYSPVRRLYARDHGPAAVRRPRHPPSVANLASTGNIDADSSALPWIWWPTPVASGAGGGREPKRVLIPYCESSTAAAALRKAADLCSAMNADAWVLHVHAWDPMPGGRLFIETPSDVLAIVETAMTYFAWARRGFEQHRAPGPTRRIADSIVAESQRLAVDSIVVGTHGRGPMSASLKGSTSLAVVRRAACPVILVRVPPSRRSLLRGWERWHRNRGRSRPRP
jgi:nucleotide-binding universal stress UspA family protein